MKHIFLWVFVIFWFPLSAGVSADDKNLSIEMATPDLFSLFPQEIIFSVKKQELSTGGLQMMYVSGAYLFIEEKLYGWVEDRHYLSYDDIFHFSQASTDEATLSLYRLEGFVILPHMEIVNQEIQEDKAMVANTTFFYQKRQNIFLCFCIFFLLLFSSSYFSHITSFKKQNKVAPKTPLRYIHKISFGDIFFYLIISCFGGFFILYFDLLNYYNFFSYPYVSFDFPIQKTVPIILFIISSFGLQIFLLWLYELFYHRKIVKYFLHNTFFYTLSFIVWLVLGLSIFSFLDFYIHTKIFSYFLIGCYFLKAFFIINVTYRDISFKNISIFFYLCIIESIPFFFLAIQL